VAALLGSRRWLPRNRTSAAAKSGYVASLLVIACIAIDQWRGAAGPAPIIELLAALLCLLHLTFARRAGAGLRVVSAAYGSARPWLERANIALAMRVARPLLVAAVIVLAATMRQHSFTLAGLAGAFAIVWLGSLPRLPRTSMRIAVPAVALLLASPLWASFAPPWNWVGEILDEPDAGERQARIQAAEKIASRADRPLPNDKEAVAARLADRIDKPPDGALDPKTAALRRDQARDALQAALLLAPDDGEFQRLERALMRLDGVHPVRLDEALSEHAAGRPALLRDQCTEIARHLPAPKLRELLQAPQEPPTLQWTLALADDLAQGYGTAPPLTRDFRQYLLRRALSGRALLRPEPLTGTMLLACMGLAALALAVALALGLAPRAARQ
jgi:hypothetical protein